MISIDQARHFAQQNPRYTCRYARKFKELSDLKGYQIKCRSINCSLECNANWAYKHGLCLARHLHDNLPDEATVYKGHLTMPKDASPEMHRAAKDAFLLALRRWAKRHGQRLELHAVIHVTDPKNAHWDFHLWTTASYRRLRAFLNRAWQRAGGGHSSISEPDSVDATARYQAKPAEINPISKEFHLPSHQKVLGIDTQWSTRGFWCGTSIDEIWSKIIADWLVQSTKIKRDITDTFDNCKTPYQDTRHIAGEDLSRDRLEFAYRLPDNPSEAISLADVALGWGVSADYAREVLQHACGVACTNGEFINGNHSWNAWYRTKEKNELIREFNKLKGCENHEII